MVIDFSKNREYLLQSVSAAPLAVFRVLFGFLMLISIIRFWNNGWIESLYLNPSFHFSYYGFEWVKPLGDFTYLLFFVCAISAFTVAIGYKYRISIILFFLSFTYIELMDKTTYLNHYYFISIMSFVLIFLPANSYFSLDAYISPIKRFDKIPRWSILSVKILLGIVYFYAGLAKLNSEWLFQAMPLKLWLPANQNLWIIGNLLTQDWFIYGMAWCGAIYDLSIPFLLFNKKTRSFAFLLVVIFHIFTRILFPIGMFPFIMILCTLIFFSDRLHQKMINYCSSFFVKILKIPNRPTKNKSLEINLINQKIRFSILVLFFVFQLLFPFRYLAYPGELFWTEEGFRFSWRVMLIEKVGYTVFVVEDGESGKKIWVEPSDYLTPFQLKQMSFQPDFILEFAHFIAKKHEKKGVKNPKVFVQSFVALNGRNAVRYIDPKVDLAKEKESFKPKKWILKFNDEIYGL